MASRPLRLRSRIARPVFLCFGLAALSLSGCTTFSALNSAARNLDAYELNPLPPQPGQTSTRTLVFVADPSVSGAVGSERIVVRPTALQVAFLGDGRWVEPGPVMIRNLIARSLANSNRLAMVSTNSVGPLPDFTILTDVETFEAQIGSPTGAAARAEVAMTITVVRDADGRLVASRRFARAADAPNIEADSVAAAFDAAMGPLLREATGWATGVMTGRPSA
jgi:cholesterol transport system auxiliary component